MSKLTTTTWADGFGVWHASVPISGSPQRDVMLARKAILAELEQRVRYLDPSRVHVTREHVTNHGTAHYVEKSY